eukprot:15475861-Alexandrium_andersonii.AAC.1
MSTLVLSPACSCMSTFVLSTACSQQSVLKDSCSDVAPLAASPLGMHMPGHGTPRRSLERHATWSEGRVRELVDQWVADISE